MKHEITEPIWYLKSIPRSEYYQTRHWQNRRESFKESFGNNIMCQCCGMVQVESDSGETFEPRWHVHHLTYENLGFESDEDLSLLCSACHNVVHKPESDAAIYWLNHLREMEREVSEDSFVLLRPHSSQQNN